MRFIYFPEDTIEDYNIVEDYSLVLIRADFRFHQNL